MLTRTALAVVFAPVVRSRVAAQRRRSPSTRPVPKSSPSRTTSFPPNIPSSPAAYDPGLACCGSHAAHRVRVCRSVPEMLKSIERL